MMKSCAWIIVLLNQLYAASTLDSDSTPQKRLDSEGHEKVLAAGEGAVISVGMLDALDAVPGITRYLDSHKEYAEEFRTFGRNAVALANEIMGHRLSPAVEEILLYFTAAFELHTYDRPVYVGPGTNPDTEQLRSTLRMLNRLSAAVPEDPKEGGELLMLSFAYARHLQVLSLIATGSAVYDIDMLEEVRHKNAMFRLSFRTPSEMEYTDAERDRIVEHTKMNIEDVRRGMEAGIYPSSWLQSILEASKQIMDAQAGRQDHEEL